MRDTPVGSDVCFEKTNNVKHIKVESTLSRVREERLTDALFVNTTGAPVTLKQGLMLGKCLLYDRNIIPEPLPLPTTCVAAVGDAPSVTEGGLSPSVESFVKVVDYPELKSSLIQTLEEYRDVIALPGEPLGVTDKAEHHIRLKPNTKPVFINAYRLPHSQRDAVQSTVEDMLQQGVIQESFSLWNSPLFLVPKKDGSLRPVIDFRRVNEITVDDHYPLPVLRDLLMSLGRGSTIFSSLDLLSGYWQLPMTPESREITAFSTGKGHYKFVRMPFGF